MSSQHGSILYANCILRGELVFPDRRQLQGMPKESACLTLYADPAKARIDLDVQLPRTTTGYPALLDEQHLDDLLQNTRRNWDDG